jgi:hypothetical protein
MEAEIRARKDLAVKLDIFGKAKLIVEELGKSYHTQGQFISACGLGGDYYTGEYGDGFENDSLKVEIYGEKRDSLRISQKKRSTRMGWFPKTEVSEVYLENGDRLEIFRGENSWIKEFDGMYSRAVENERDRKMTDEQEVSDRKAREASLMGVKQG